MYCINDDMVHDMISNKNLNEIVTELFIRERKLNIFTVFITQSYFFDMIKSINQTSAF